MLTLFLFLVLVFDRQDTGRDELGGRRAAGIGNVLRRRDKVEDSMEVEGRIAWCFAGGSSLGWTRQSLTLKVGGCLVCGFSRVRR